MTQGCTTCGSLAARRWKNGERMRKWRGNREIVRKWRGNVESESFCISSFSPHFLILSPFPHYLSISSSSSHSLSIFSQAGCQAATSCATLFHTNAVTAVTGDLWLSLSSLGSLTTAWPLYVQWLQATGMGQEVKGINRSTRLMGSMGSLGIMVNHRTCTQRRAVRTTHKTPSLLCHPPNIQIFC